MLKWWFFHKNVCLMTSSSWKPLLTYHSFSRRILTIETWWRGSCFRDNVCLTTSSLWKPQLTWHSILQKLILWSTLKPSKNSTDMAIHSVKKIIPHSHADLLTASPLQKLWSYLHGSWFNDSPLLHEEFTTSIRECFKSSQNSSFLWKCLFLLF